LIFRFCRAAGFSEDKVRGIKLTPAWWDRSLHDAHTVAPEPIGVVLAMQSTQEGQQPALNSEVVLPAFARHYGYPAGSPEIEFFTEHAAADIERCRRSLRARRSTVREPYRYRESGLGSVGLVGVTVYACPQCHEEAAEIPRVGLLHQAIAEVLLTRRGPLAGDELRFLRKHAGIPAAQFAELLGIDPAHLSHAEHGKRGLGVPTERLVRAVIAAAMKRTNVSEMLLTAPGAAALRAREKPALFMIRGNVWRRQAA
jgi:DNA-binding transcriptional regulator YiaG